MDAHEQLVATRNELARRGHAKFVAVDEDGQVCIYGAWGFASRQLNVSHCEGIQPLAMALGFSDASAVCYWNNEPVRTLESVLARFDGAIARTAPEPADPMPELVVYA